MSGAAEGPGWWRATDDKWYPPDAHPDEAYRQQWADAPTESTEPSTEPAADATTSLAPPSSPPEGATPPAPPTPSTPAAPPAAPPPRAPAASEPASDPGSTPRKRRPVVGIAIGVALVVLVAVIGVVIISRGSTPADAVTLEPVGAAGDDPFTTAVTVHEVSSFPSDIAKVAGTGAPGSTASSGNGVVFTGTSVGLYGGTQDQHACDAKQLKDFLAQNPDKASAWAGVQGVKVDGIVSFVDSLTPVVLTRDTWVTNHGYRDGKATSLQSVLQAGTAVMVDSTGLPRVKCNCGNPLLAPSSSSGTLSNTRGTAWPGFNVTVVVTVQPGPTVTTLQLVDVTTGQIIDQPVGSAPGVAVALESSGAYGNGGQILVNAGGVNGPTWERDPVDASYLTDLAYGNGYFLAVGPGMVLKSDATGHGWQKVATQATSLTSVAYGDGKWIGTDEGNPSGTSSPAVYESTDGTTWTKRDAVLPTPTVGTLGSIAFGDGRWAAVGPGDTGGGTRVYTSGDGTTWKPASATLTDAFTMDVAHGDEGWLALTAAGPRVGQTHGVALTSLDGTSWTQSATTPADLDAGAPVFADGRWNAARNPGLDQNPSGFDLLSSHDGTAWTPAGRIPYTPSSATASGVAVLSIAVGGSASVTAPSSPTPSTAPGTTASASSSGTTVAIANPGTGGSTILVSPSGVSGPWATAYTAPSPNTLAGVGFGNGSFVAVGTGTCNQSGKCTSVVLKASASGRDWTQAATIPDSILDVAYGNARWLAVGATGSFGAVVYQSTDGSTWTKLTLPPNDSAYSPEFVTLTSVAFGDGRWIATAIQGNGSQTNYQLLASTDGTTWSPVGAATSGTAQIAHGDSGWLAIGASSSFDGGARQLVTTGMAQVGADGSNWRSSPTTPKDLSSNGPIFSGGRWYVTRNGAEQPSTTSVDLLSSTDGITWTPAGTIPIPGATASGRGGPSITDLAAAA